MSASFVVFASVITAAGFARTVSDAFPMDHPEMQSYIDNVEFIDDIMIADTLWYPIIRHSVRMPAAMSRQHFDHFGSPESVAKDRVDSPQIVVNPFDEIVELKTSASPVGTEVSFVVEAVKRSLVCLVTKYVSIQGFLLHHMMEKEDNELVLIYLLNWMQEMLRFSMDKLAAVDKIVPEIGKMEFHVTTLLMDGDADLKGNKLYGFSERMFNELGNTCATPEGSSHYKSVITELKKSMLPEELLAAESLLVDENLKGLSDLYNIKEIGKYYGTLQIEDDAKPNEFNFIDKEELKKMLTVIHIKFHQLLSNLHIKTMAESQWNNILTFTNALFMEKNVPVL